MSIPPIHLQPRDLDIVATVNEVRVLDTPTIAARFFEGDRACQRRLKLLTAHDILEPLHPSVSFVNGTFGRQPTLFRVGVRGAEVLAAVQGSPLHRRGRRVQRPETLLHTLGIAKVHLVLNDACALRTFAKPQWIDEQDTYGDLVARLKKRKGDKKTLPASERFILLERFQLPDGRTTTCWPDASCHLHITTKDGPARDLLVYWEIDRSTERLGQVSAKLAGYQAMLKAESYRTHWPTVTEPIVRIFFVVPSQARLENIADALSKVRSTANASVRLTTTGDLTPKQFFSHPIWRTIDGHCLTILRTSLPAAS